MTPAAPMSSHRSAVPRAPGRAKKASASPGTSTSANSFGSPMPPLRRAASPSAGAGVTKPTTALSTAPAM